MNEIFNFKRFGKYFLHDLKTCRDRYWISLLVCAGMPFICFAVYQMLSLLITGVFAKDSCAVQIASMCVAFFIVVLTFPVKTYGLITDRKAGPDWVLLPASALEKTLSMLIMSCVVLPLCFFSLMLGLDALMGVVFPSNWPEPVMASISTLMSRITEGSDGILSVNLPALACYSWCSGILVLVLGCIFFKKAKIAKTILVMFVVGNVFGTLMSFVLLGSPTLAQIFNGGSDSLFEDPAYLIGFFRNFNAFITVYVWAYLATVIALIYVRVKTIKH